MSTIKSYTDLDQSKKLAEILPLESADMWYQYTGISIKDGSKKPIYFPMVIRDCESDEDIPCWSLVALLGVLSYPSLYKIFSGWRCDSYLGKSSDNPVDACYELILELHEFKML